VPDGIRFCGGCGSPVAQPGSTPESPPVGPQPPPAGRPTFAPPFPPAVSQPVPPPIGERTPAPFVAPPAGIQPPPPPAPSPVGWYPSGPGAPGGIGGPGGPGAPGGKGRRGLWIAIAVAAVVVIAAAVTVPLVLARGGNDEVTVTSTPRTTSTTAKPVSTTETATSSTSSTSGTSSTSTSVTIEAGMPGDSAGEWVETNIPGAPAQVVSVALSNDVLLMGAQKDSGYGLYAYTFLTDSMVELPVESTDLGGIDIDDNIATWAEATYDETSSSYIDQRIYTYALPDGPKVDVAGAAKSVSYPQRAGMWVTWVEPTTWDANPEEYMAVPIYGSFVSLGTETANKPMQLVPSAVAPIMGDATWSYSLGKTFLAWEQAAAVGGLDTGTYVLDLMKASAEPRSIGADAWRPSVSIDRLVYWENGLQFLDLTTGEKREVDPKGDFPTNAFSFVAYYRAIESGDGSAYEIVARGLTGGYEQVLATQTDAPWLSAAIAASGTHVAFVADGALHVFEWKGQ
jgi:hypothetical protein